MFDEIGLIIFILCVIIYLILMMYSPKRKKPSERNLLKKIYRNWVENRIKGEPLITIQALRNFIMGNSIFISALFILIGILVGLYNTAFFSQRLFFGIPDFYLGLVQISLNVIVIIFSLFNFILSIRFIVRTTLLMSGNPSDHTLGKIGGFQLAKKAFISAQNHWMLGNRGLFYLISALFWLVDGVFFIIMTIAVTIYLILFQDIWMLSKKQI